MRDSRIGECLWSEWTGYAYSPSTNSDLIFYTEGHVDLENDIVRRALASSLQRDGSAISLGDGYRLVESSVVTHGYAGEVDGDRDYTMCDETGETPDGDYVDDLIDVTWVEFFEA
jgi:hypothetical protein